MHIESFFDPETATWSYVVSDGRVCAIIDPVLDYDAASGRTSTKSADSLIEYITCEKLQVEWILETHIHADHLTAAQYLKEKLGGKTAISAQIKEALQHWVPIFDTAEDTPLDGSQFDVLLEDGAEFLIGTLKASVMFTPGHTPVCATYLIGDAAFVGDTIFMPYVGTARTDFPGGSAATLYASIQKLYALPDATRIFVGHDYPPQGQQPGAVVTVGEQKQSNVLVGSAVAAADYIEARNKRDVGKPVPKLLFPALQVNLMAGRLPKFIKIPVNAI